MEYVKQVVASKINAVGKKFSRGSKKSAAKKPAKKKAAAKKAPAKKKAAAKKPAAKTAMKPPSNVFVPPKNNRPRAQA